MTHTLCVLKPDRSAVNPCYLLHFARSPMFLGGLSSTMNPNVGVPTLGYRVNREAPIPVPDLEEQSSIAAALDMIETKLASLTPIQRAVSTELSVLALSVFSHAFSGQL